MNISLTPLNSINLAMAHGLGCQNCLAHLETLLQYVTSGVALYGVHSASGVAGTIALSLDCTGIHPIVEVQEVAGIGNEVAGIDLRRLAQSLCNGWSEPQISQWINFDFRCETLRLRYTTETTQ